MPAYIPLSIATFSIIGEKLARSLEPVLAAPIRTSELLAGKAVAALVPGVLAGLGDLRRVRRARVARVRAGAVRRRDRPVVAGRRVPARAGGRAVVGRGRGDRQRPGQRPARRAADRRRRDRARSSGSCSSRRPAPCWSGRLGYVLLAVMVLVDLARGPARRRPAVRPRGDPDPLALRKRFRPLRRFWSLRCRPTSPKLDIPG